MVTDRTDEGWTCHLLTFLFTQLPGKRSAVIGQMKNEIQRVYSTLLTRVHRKPKTASSDELPVLIAAADLPIHKRDRSSSPIFSCNAGLHFHAILLIPSDSRLKEPADVHFRSNKRTYCGRLGAVSSIHVRPVSVSIEQVVDYLFKTIKRGSVTYDEAVLVLPRSEGELTD
jgi:hypothetical protein